MNNSRTNRVPGRSNVPFFLWDSCRTWNGQPDKPGLTTTWHTVTAGPSTNRPRMVSDHRSLHLKPTLEVTPPCWDLSIVTLYLYKLNININNICGFYMVLELWEKSKIKNYMILGIFFSFTGTTGNWRPSGTIGLTRGRTVLHQPRRPEWRPEREESRRDS